METDAPRGGDHGVDPGNAAQPVRAELDTQGCDGPANPRVIASQRTMAPKHWVALIAFAISLPLDLATKLLVDRYLTYADRVPVIEGFFYLTHVRNPGAAFGLFADGDPTVRIGFFAIVSLVAILIILSFFRQLAPGDRLSALALGLILGGANGYSWPDFNLADSFIVVGVGILILELLASEGEDRAGEESDGPVS